MSHSDLQEGNLYLQSAHILNVCNVCHFEMSVVMLVSMDLLFKNGGPQNRMSGATALQHTRTMRHNVFRAEQGVTEGVHLPNSHRDEITKSVLVHINQHPKHPLISMRIAAVTAEARSDHAFCDHTVLGIQIYFNIQCI